MQKTNFDAYLTQQLRDPEFAKRYLWAGEAWDAAIQSNEQIRPPSRQAAPRSAKTREEGCESEREIKIPPEGGTPELKRRQEEEDV